jgi:peptide/nickel transport system ATP-binding protein
VTATLPETRTGVVLDVRDLQVEITIPRRPPIRPVRGVSFTVSAGQRVGIVGESGSGKSLTALSLMQLLPPRARIAAGEVHLAGRELTHASERELARVRGGKISTVYQDPMSSLNPLLTVGRQVTEAILAHESIGGREARERAVDVLRDVGLPQPERRIDDYPHQFSGGMRQRVMIAMAICTNPDVLIADEPTTALDVTTQARIMEMLARIVEERQMGVILITHDLGLASSFCDVIHVMYGGRIVESGRADAVLRTPAHPYSEALLASICSLDRDVNAPIAAISGQPPLPHQLPSGCPFHPRCAHAREICTTEAPPLVVAREQTAECHFPVGELSV